MLENDYGCGVDYVVESHEIDDKTRRIVEKYRLMVDTFKAAEEKWDLKQQGYDSASRSEKIALGCFAGAKHEGIVKALEILYIDYLPLRVAGDIIFKFVRKLIKKF